MPDAVAGEDELAIAFARCIPTRLRRLIIEHPERRPPWQASAPGVVLRRIRVPVAGLTTQAASPVPGAAEVRAFIHGPIPDRLEAGLDGWLAELRTVSVAFLNLTGIESDLGEMQRWVNAVAEAVGTSGGLTERIRTEDGGLTMVLGNVVNRAARLVKSEVRGAVVDGATRSAARRAVRFERLPDVALKGLPSNTERYRPTEVAERPPPGQRRIIGRRPQLELFDDALVALERGERRRYLVVGEAGIGKSRFLRAASERAAASPVRTLTVSGSSLERGTPFYAWRRTLLGLLGLGDRPSPDAVARRVEAITGMRMGPGAAAIEGLAPSATEVAVEPSAMTGAVHEVLARVFQRLATDAPILLILEVAGQLDSASWSLVDTVYGLDTPVLVLGAIRTPELDEVPAEAMPVVSDAERIRLDALAPDDVTEMIRVIFDVDDVPPRFIDTVLSRAGGHPLFVEEMAMSMRDQGAATVDQRDHSLRIDWELLERMAVPASLHGIIGSRIGRLGATEQMTLKVAGVLGLSFEPGDAAAIHPSPRSVDDDIRHMTSIGLLTAGSDARSASVAFRHGLVAEVAYSLLTGDQRRRLHAAAAEHLTGRPGAEAVLAHHWTEAERPDRAFPALVTAGERALVGSAAHEAAGYFRTALGMVPAASRLQEGAVRRRLGQALDMLGDDPGMRTELLSAAKLFGYPLPGGRLAFGVGIGRQLVRLGWE